MLSLTRREAIEVSYQSMRPAIQFLGRKIGAGNAFIDVGSGEGIISLKMAEDLKADAFILVDKQYAPVVNLPPNAAFYKIDVHSDEFVEKFENRANIVTCITAFHEFDDPVKAASNLIRILPEKGVTLVMDYTEEGWEIQQVLAASGNTSLKRHFLEDMRRAIRFGLDKDIGIRKFWEEAIFPGVPGECYLTLNGHAYSMLYVAWQWGEVKEPPPHIKRVLESRARK